MRWGKSNNGPDWTDIRLLMGSMETLHEMQLTLIMSRDGMYDGPGVRVVALAVSNKPMSGVTQGQLSVSGVWPNNKQATFAGMVYDVLLMLDRQILLEWWDQNRLA